MRIRHGFMGLLACGLVASQAVAQSVEQTSFLFRRPAPCDSCATPVTGPVTIMPTDPSQKGQAPQAPAVDPQAFAQAPAAGGEAGLSFNPAMFGDLGASGSGRISVLRTYTGVITIPPSPSPPPNGTPASTQIITRQQLVTFDVPIVGHGSFKISDNESPRPTDRVFFTYNYFDGVNAGGPEFNLHREVMGFEKTFLDGNASFGMRLPFLQTTGGDFSGFSNHEIGDITLIGKYAVLNDTETGNLVSGGLALTVPSSDHAIVLADGNALRSVLFQPFVGWIFNSGDLYAHGFHSIVVPTDSRDVTELNNDVAVGYWLFRDAESFVRGVVPTIEGHLYTPLNHHNRGDLISATDIFTLTAGINVVMPGNSTLGAGIGVPLTGPKPDNVEALVSFNFRF